MAIKMKKLLADFPPITEYGLVILLFLVLIFIALGKSLNFALFGDDWFMFYVIDKTYGPGKVFPYLSLEGYSQPWGVMNICLMIVRSVFGYESYGYFLVSMMLRVLAAFACYVFLYKFLRTKSIALISSLFVLVGYSGIESSNYVLHMNVYLVILFLFLSLTFLIDSAKNLSKFIIACIFFAISLAVNPIRSHGLLPFMLIFELVYSLFITRVGFKKIIVRLTALSISALIIYKLGFFGNVTPGFIKFDLINQMIRDGNFTFISAFITNLGKAFLPDNYSVDLAKIIYLFGPNWYKRIILTGFLVESLIFLLLSRFMREKLKSLSVILVALVINFGFITLSLRGLPRDVGLFSILINSLIGIFFISFTIWAVYILFQSKNKTKTAVWVGMIAGPVVILTSFVVPLLFNPGAVMGSDTRYLSVSLSGVAITFASLSKFLSENNIKLLRLFSAILFLLFILHVRSDQKYLTNLYPVRNQEVTESMWRNIFKYIPRETYPDKLLLFYFDDKENSGLAHNTVLFGFPPRMAIEYKIKEQEKIPTFTNIYDEVVSAVTDGKSFLRLGYPQEKISINQIYAFKFTKTGELLDITHQTRQDLGAKIKKL